jgi:dihydrofolate reductase
MRKLCYHVAATVDGFIATADHRFDFFAAQGEHVDDYLATLRTYDTVVMGRRTYEVGLGVGVADPYPWADTWVFSRTLPAGSARVRVTGEDPASVVAGLKARAGGPIYLCGGGALAARLLTARLVDEVAVKVNPHLLGAGVPLAALSGVRVDLALRSAQVYRSGVVLLRYEVR